MKSTYVFFVLLFRKRIVRKTGERWIKKFNSFAGENNYFYYLVLIISISLTFQFEGLFHSGDVSALDQYLNVREKSKTFHN